MNRDGVATREYQEIRMLASPLGASELVPSRTYANRGYTIARPLMSPAIAPDNKVAIMKKEHPS
jgi:hypothetical protein